MEAATARAPARRPRRAAATRPAPARPAPARRPTPARRPARPAPRRHRGGQLIQLAGGTASAVRRLPDSSLIHRLTRGRAWIAVLGTLLAGIVALNVVTLSLATTAAQVGQNVQALDMENPLLRSRDAQISSTARVREDASALGLALPPSDEVRVVEASADDVQVAVRRLAAIE